MFHAGIHAFTTQAECAAFYGTRGTCVDYLGKVCANTYDKDIWTTEFNFNEVYDSVVNKGEYVDIVPVSDGSDGTPVGTWGPRICHIFKKK